MIEPDDRCTKEGLLRDLTAAMAEGGSRYFQRTCINPRPGHHERAMAAWLHAHRPLNVSINTWDASDDYFYRHAPCKQPVPWRTSDPKQYCMESPFPVLNAGDIMIDMAKPWSFGSCVERVAAYRIGAKKECPQRYPWERNWFCIGGGSLVLRQCPHLGIVGYE